MDGPEEIIVNELNKNPNVHITDLEKLSSLPIGEVCKIRYFWKREKKRENRIPNPAGSRLDRKTYQPSSW
jgi:hypothetical protein